MAAHPDVLILGGGVIGLTTAYFLAREKIRVRVIDRGPMAGEASWAGAGIIPPLASNVMSHPLERLRQLSVARFPDFSAELRSFTQIDNEFHTCGGIEYVSTVDDLDRWKAAGVGYEFDERSFIAKLAYSQVRNPRHLKALILACRKLNVDLQPKTTVDPQKLPDVGQTLIAAGAWSSELLPPEFQNPVHPVQGQIVLFHPPEPVLNQIIIDRHRYLVPRKDGRVLVGSTEEPQAGFDKAITKAGIANLLRYAYLRCPALKKKPIEQAWAGLRPGSRDGWPYLGPVPGRDNLFIATGHYRAGLQLSIATGEGMAAMLLGKPMAMSFDPFRLGRGIKKHPKPLFRS